MKTVHYLGTGTVLLAGVLAALLWRDDSSGSAGADSREARATPVQVSTVRLHDFADTVEAIGTVRANESVDITAGVSDIIEELRFRSGDEVSRGDILVVLDATEERAALAEADALLVEARRDSERLTSLADDGVATRSEGDQARSLRQQREAQRDIVRARIADRTIRAPFDGVIGLRNLSPGAHVETGEVLLTLDDLSRVNLDFSVPERFLSVLEPGLSIRANAVAWPDTAFTGEISDIDSRVDPVSRTVTVRAELPNEGRRLRPGMLLTVEVQRNLRQAPALPEVSVLRNGSRTAVFSVDETGEQVTAVRRQVRLGLRAGALIEVVDGLQEGDTIISEGMDRTSDGQAVTIEARRDTGARTAEEGAT